MLCEESLARQLDTGVLAWAKSWVPASTKPSAENGMEVGRPMDKSIHLWNQSIREVSGREFCGNSPGPGGGHETGFCTFDVLHALMREAPC